jgi:hypothetical protein
MRGPRALDGLLDRFHVASPPFALEPDTVPGPKLPMTNKIPPESRTSI